MPVGIAQLGIVVDRVPDADGEFLYRADFKPDHDFAFELEDLRDFVERCISSASALPASAFDLRAFDSTPPASLPLGVTRAATDAASFMISIPSVSTASMPLID